MKLAGVILAGGTASRMGADKAFMSFAGTTLIGAVIERVRYQVDPLALNIRSDQRDACQRYCPGYPLLEDALGGGIGPLGGIAAGLVWAARSGAKWVASFPADTPFLPTTLVAELEPIQRANGDNPVVAIGDGHVQNLCTIWPVACLEVLRHAVMQNGLRSVWAALELLNAERRAIRAEPNAFFNVNSPEDFARANAIARGVSNGIDLA